MTLYIFVLHDHKMWRLYTFYMKLGISTPKLGLLTPKLTLGDPFPTNEKREHIIYPRKTHLGEKLNNLFLGKFLEFNKR